MPIAITSISTANHPVTVGVADAFYVDHHLYFGVCFLFKIIVSMHVQTYDFPGLVRRYIYEYDRVNVSAMYSFDTESSLVLQPIPSMKLTCRWCC